MPKRVGVYVRHVCCMMRCTGRIIGLQADPPIRAFSIRGFSYPRFTAARKKNGKLKK